VTSESTCREFRERWLEAEAPAALDAHAERCAECARWVRSVRLQISLLGTLARDAAPARLDPLVARALAAPAASLPSGRVERIASHLRALGRQRAPAELAERLRQAALERGAPASDEALRARELASPALRAVTGLPRVAAPAVLHRLVREELADPAGARAKRFPGDLERLSTPESLERRVLHELRRRIERPGLAIPLALAAAALFALVLRYAGLGEDGGGAPQRRLSFEVVRVEGSAAELDPMARSLADALAGGLLAAPARDPEDKG
jgi:hypothetical protein